MSVMARRQQSRYDLANLAMGGKLGAFLAKQRSENASFETIAFALRVKGVEVSGETVRQWCSVAPESTEAVQ